LTESEIHRVAKESLALGFMREGYMTGIEVSEDGSRFDVKAVKGDKEYVFEVHFTHLGGSS
jgi:hypothetical protein